MALPPLSQLLTRVTPFAPIVAKGSELLFTEGDNNLIIIYQYLNSLASVSGTVVAPYNAGTTYIGTPKYVTYGGNLWLHIALSSTGVTPGTNPAVWELTSVGALAHIQNTDTKLAEGTASEVSAVELRAILDDLTISVTRAGLLALIASSELRKGYAYFITDRNIFVTAVSTNEVAQEGIYYAQNPDFQASSGLMLSTGTDAVWEDNTSQWWADIVIAYPVVGARIGKNVIFQGKTYSAITGNNTATTPDLDPTNWGAGHPKTLIPEAETCRYNLVTDEILERRDTRGNIVKISPALPGALEKWFQFGNDNVRDNKIEGAFNMEYNHGVVKGNKVTDDLCNIDASRNGSDGSYFSAEINFNIFEKSLAEVKNNGGLFNYNHAHESWGLDFNNNEGNYKNNNFYRCQALDGLDNKGQVYESEFHFLSSVRISTQLTGTVSRCLFDTGIEYDETGANAGYKIRGTWGNPLRSETIADTDNTVDLGYSRLTEITVTGTGSATLTEVTGLSTGEVVRIKPVAGDTITLDYGGGINIISPDGTVSDILVGSNGDYALGVFMDNRFEVIKVKN